MERSLPGGVVIHDAQPRRSGTFNDPSAQRRDLGRLSLVFRSPDPLANPGSRLERPADKLDRVLQVGTILQRVVQCPVCKIGQSVQTGAPSIEILLHAPHNSTQGKRFRVGC